MPAMRAADPIREIARSWLPRGWIDTSWFLKSCIQKGLLNLVDAVSVHPYQIKATPKTVGGQTIRRFVP